MSARTHAPHLKKVAALMGHLLSVTSPEPNMPDLKCMPCCSPLRAPQRSRCSASLATHTSWRRTMSCACGTTRCVHQRMTWCACVYVGGGAWSSWWMAVRCALLLDEHGRSGVRVKLSGCTGCTAAGTCIFYVCHIGIRKRPMCMLYLRLRDAAGGRRCVIMLWVVDMVRQHYCCRMPLAVQFIHATIDI
jgi:hypothetical protein